MINGYADVAVVVSDSQKAVKWYSEVLGMKVAFNKGHLVAVTPDVKAGVVLHLCGGFAPLEPGNTGIALRADDLLKTYEELSKKGVKFTKKPAKDDRSAKFVDPDGNEFWLFDSRDMPK